MIVCNVLAGFRFEKVGNSNSGIVKVHCTVCILIKLSCPSQDDGALAESVSKTKFTKKSGRKKNVLRILDVAELFAGHGTFHALHTIATSVVFASFYVLHHCFSYPPSAGPAHAALTPLVSDNSACGGSEGAFSD